MNTLKRHRKNDPRYEDLPEPYVGPGKVKARIQLACI